MFNNGISISVYLVVTFLVLLQTAIILYRRYLGRSDESLILSPTGLVIALNLAGSYVTAITILGVPGFSNLYGLSWIWTILIQTSVGYAPLLFLGSRLIKIAHKCNANNILDVIQYKYKSNLIILFSAIIMVIFVFSMLVAQMIGVKELMAVVDHNDGNLGLLWFTILILVYFLLAGARPIDIFYTVEGVLVIILSIVLVVTLVHAGGGLASIKDKIWHMNPAYFSPTGANQKLTYLYIASYWLCIGFGMIGVPSVSFRAVVYSGHFKAAIIGSTIIMTIILFNMNFAGFLSIPLIKHVSTPDRVIPLVVINYISPMFRWMFLTIIVLASIFAINLQLRVIKVALMFIFNRPYNQNEYRFNFTEVTITAVVIILMFVFAVNNTSNITKISLYAIGGLASSFMWMIIFIPYNLRFINKSAAFFSMLVGVIFYVLFYNLQLNWRQAFYPVTLPIIFSLIVYIVVGYSHYFIVNFIRLLKR